MLFLFTTDSQVLNIERSGTWVRNLFYNYFYIQEPFSNFVFIKVLNIARSGTLDNYLFVDMAGGNP